MTTAETRAPAFDRRAIPPQASESRWDATDGHSLRRIDWRVSGTAKGSILFFPGRGDNYEKYLESLHEWFEAGWNVTAADWRGQAGSGRFGADEVTGHIDSFDTWLADLGAFWRDWKAQTPGPHVLGAHSMGGHLVLRGAVEQYVDPDAMFLSAPMLGFTGPPVPLLIGHAVARLMTRIGDPRRPAWKWSEKPGEIPRDRMKLLTHCEDRYADEFWWREERPELKMGPGSWGWVERAYASTRALFARGALESLDTPVLVLNATTDKLVDPEANRRAAKRLPNGKLVEFGPEAHHEILREVDAVRDRVQAEIFAFLDETLTG